MMQVEEGAALWLIEPLSFEVKKVLARLVEDPRVDEVAVMPDVHLSEPLCNGMVIGSREWIFPDAVGGDIGCGMAAQRFDVEASWLDDEMRAAWLLSHLGREVPIHKQTQETLPLLPDSLASRSLSSPSLEKMKQREGRWQFGTLGRGNHFLECQADQEGALWVMVHSGSRAMGQAIRKYHLTQARATQSVPGWLTGLRADTEEGQAYIEDMSWALAYAAASREQMLSRVGQLLGRRWSILSDPEMPLWNVHHNHVLLEEHQEGALWVHRKGANAAQAGRPGIIPGSMGTCSFLVEGRGHPRSLCSSSHGAGRAMSRTEARKTLSLKQLEAQMGDVWFDQRTSHQLREEAPTAYKDIRAVMRAQKDLVKIHTELHPILSYKGT